MTARAIGGPWSPVLPDGREVCRYGDPDDACERAREDSRGIPGTIRVVDGLRGPKHGPGPLPAGVRTIATFRGGEQVPEGDPDTTATHRGC